MFGFDIPYMVIGLVVIGLLFAVTFIAAMARYKRCPPNQILVKSGWIGGGGSSKAIHGGATFVWPLIQEFDYLELAPINTDIDLKGALSKQNIRVSVPSSFTFAIGTTPELMNAAAERLLGQTADQIEQQAREMIFGQLRATIATMDIEEINGDREKFEKLVMENIETELRKIGLYLINVNISDISDESGYLKALGQEAASRAVNDAVVKVANNDRDGAKGSAEAKAEERKSVADAEARAITGENSAAVVQANSQAEREVAEAEARRLSDAAKAVASAKADTEGYAAEQVAEEARADRDRAAQFASEVVPAEIDAQKIVVEAKAALEAAELQAKATQATEKAALAGKAEGFAEIVRAANGDPKAAAMLLIVEQMPAIVAAQADAISNIEFGEIVVVGGGQNGADGAANFLQSTTAMLPGLHAMAKAAGIELPDFLGSDVKGALAAPESDESTDDAVIDDGVVADDAVVSDDASTEEQS